MAARVRKPRPQSARLDILSAMAASVRPPLMRSTSPTDSLSPCREDFKHDNARTTSAPSDEDNNNTNDQTTSITGPDEDDWFEKEPACLVSGKPHAGPTDEAGSNDVQQEQHVRSPQRQHSTPAAAAAAFTSHASIPPREPPYSLLSRSHRPASLNVGESNGATTLPAKQLKQALRQNRFTEGTSQAPSSRQPEPSPERGRRRQRRSPTTKPNDRSGSGASMGNQHSHHASGDEGAFDDSDARSTQSGYRQSRLKAARLPRRGSMNVFKKLDAKSPLSPGLTGTVIEVPRAATAPNLDGMGDDDDDLTEDEQERSRARHAHRHSAPSPSIPMHSASPTATLTEESAARPISASDTITDRQPSTQVEDFADEQEEEGASAHLRVSALSPTLPAPSPIPEDSPHKYGLKDRMDTPEAATPPPEIELAKARRRSSGLAIFNEAKTLQSASFFLNGLSTARRRAESRAQSRNATDNSQNTTSNTTVITSTSAYTSATPSFIHLPASATTSTIHPYSSISHSALPHAATEADLDLNIDTANRNLGHQFKSSGFAYAPPLSLTQLRCYRSHARLLPSRNKHASVECAVCHADDENQFWSCAWCALRMCGGCRRALEGGGVPGLRERVRVAEMGTAF
ncbi:hypothetical protein Q7P37_007139 [Cladosporium fusiforme]